MAYAACEVAPIIVRASSGATRERSGDACGRAAAGKRREKKQRVLEYPAPRAAVALEPMQPISLPAENADLPEGWIEAQFPEVAARKARRPGRITWAERRRC